LAWLAGCHDRGVEKVGVLGFCMGGALSGEKTPFLRHLYKKYIILPRQARDKHRETSKI
jgi:hypothetical protein